MFKVCKYCGKEIKIDNYPEGFCSKYCFNLYEKQHNFNQIRICLYCGKKYFWKKDQGNWDKNNNEIVIFSQHGKHGISSKRFCCYECGRKYQEEIRHKNYKNKTGYDHSNQNPKVIEKMQNSFLKKYGVKNPMQFIDIKNKSQKTMIEKYGYKTNVQCEKTRAILKNNLGVEYPFQSKEIQKKVKQTCLKKYGVENFYSSVEYKNLYKNKNWVKLIKEKEYKTKKNNNSFNKSYPEEEILKKLLKKFPDTIYQYRSELYPFNCDFYIPSLDLYIEYQGIWTHGKEAYNKNNQEHIKIVNLWKEKSKEINFKNKKKNYYIKAINIWTILDPLKRKIAKRNNLNYLEFFTLEEFIKWYNNQ